MAYLERTDAANVEYDKDKDGEGEWDGEWRVMMSDGGVEGESKVNEEGEGTSGEEKERKKGVKNGRAKGNPYLGRKILVLAGEDDTLVPWVSSREVVEGLSVGGASSQPSGLGGGGGGGGANSKGKVGGGEGKVEGEGGVGRDGGRNKEGGVKKVIVYPGIGHEVTDEMIRETADFIWEWSLKP